MQNNYAPPSVDISDILGASEAEEIFDLIEGRSFHLDGDQKIECKFIIERQQNACYEQSALCESLTLMRLTSFNKSTFYSLWSEIDTFKTVTVTMTCNRKMENISFLDVILWM